MLAGYEIDRVVSSPHARCVETVEALALRRNLRVEIRDELVPDAPLADTLALLAALPDSALVCTHREVIARLVEGGLTCEKGATWLIERDGDDLVPVAYLPPPSVALRVAERAGTSA